MNDQSMIVIYSIAGAILLLLIIKSIILVDEKTVYVIQRLGKFKRMANAGFGLIIPFIDRKAGVLNLRIQQLDVDVETKTHDDVFVHVRVSVQYQVMSSKLHEAFYALDNAKHQIASYVYDDVRAEVPKMELDDVFAKKEDIAVAVRHNLGESMDDYGYLIIKALVTDIDPDSHVKESMNRINAAKRDKEATMEEAEAAKIRIVKAAEADAESKRLSGEGIAQQRLEIVRGFKESVEDFQKSLKNITHEEVMQFVLMTQYFDTLNSIGSNGKNSAVLIPHTPSAMADFQQQIIKGTLVGNSLKESIEDAKGKDIG
ncbi:SPFH domain-containing protein [Paracrocinitomix mangrovi]|uniref:SPFH domain-containing protein n=1 Tax=Paracrocinitomix mangrovi TaxID=2862509 RepID=UPI001C8E3294|nr:SPFH domain-containing protein [Paracrocinitomix mangrovi]UKN03246.1 SPFH domain-containing protein [Paracrocinitomix mangrovi]